MSDVDANPLDLERVVNDGTSRYMNCLLCNNRISVYDTSAGCQDPSLSHEECDRLPVVEADQLSGADAESPTGDSAEPTTEPEETVAPVATPVADAVADFVAATPVAPVTEAPVADPETPPEATSGMGQA